MASTDSVATSSATLAEESGLQASPLPSKRGEIGFIEGVHTQSLPLDQPVDQDTLPVRHPADRPPPVPSSSSDIPNEASLPSRASSIFSDSSSTHNVDKRTFPWRKKLPKYMGIHSMTLLLLFVQILVFAGTIVGWVFAAHALDVQSGPPPPSQVGDPNPPPQHSSGIFVHVAFAVVALAQLVFMERRVYRLRAERYASKHPGEALPPSLQRGYSFDDTTIPIAPWSRPPLPTYAAALAAGGTGDVEDAEIAQPPPPAYGKTRGSTLILAGFLRHSLRIQAQEHEDNRSESRISNHSDRPVSFLSRDEEWERRRSADQARSIEAGSTAGPN